MVDLYTALAGDIDYAAILSFVTTAEQTNAAAESRTFEFKEKLSRSNVAEAVAALANADGGLVFVGVTDTGAGASRLVGVSLRDRDGIVNSLRQLLPHDAFPEVIDVRVEGSADRLIVLLRVDADSVIHPVVVGGRVLIRYPGQSVPADREQIASLVRWTSTAGSERSVPLAHMPLAGRDSALFPDDTPPFSFQVRMIGSALLPPRAARRPWLNSAARDVVRQTLTASPLPTELWHERPPPWGADVVRWIEDRATSTSARFVSETDPTLRNPTPANRGGMYVSLDHRTLRVLLGVGVRPERVVNDAPVEPAMIDLAGLYYGLLGLLVTHVAVVRSVALALGASEPLRFHEREAWLLPGPSLTVSQIIRPDPYSRDAPGASEQMLSFIPMESGDARDDLEDLCRTWLEVAMLDAGYRDFEERLRELPRPTWASAL